MNHRLHFPSRLLTAAAMLAFLAADAQAQTRPIEFISAVPDAPAFTFLGVTPKLVERPGTLRDLGVAIQNGVGADGKAKVGFALDASVWNLIPGYDIPLASYQKNWLQYAVANLQASLATVQSASDSSALLGAIGLKTVILDRGDPMLSETVVQSLAAAIGACRPDQPGAGASAACVDSAVAEIIGNYTRDRWNAAQLSVAMAYGGRFDGGDLRSGRATGLDGWVTGAIPLGAKIQLLGQATYKNRQAVDTVPAFQALNLGFRAVGGSATFNAFLELGREWRSLDGTPDQLVIDKNVGGWSAGVEYRLSAHTWVSTGVGTRFESLAEPDRTVLFAGFKWGLTSKSRTEGLRN